MKEYEYSFKVNDLKKYIDYCKNNNYELVSVTDETRDLYSNNSNKLARITISNEIVLDFKETGDTSIVLKNREESKPIVINDLESTLSILDVLGYKQIKHLERHRIVYKKDNVKFELDSYSYPDKEYIVGIEGLKEEVDRVYEELNNI